MKSTTLALLLNAVAGATFAQGMPTSFDGTWKVHLACDDTRDKSGAVVKGYVFDFPVSIKGGELSGQRGEPGQASSLALAGVVTDSGEVRIEAQGFTGKPDYTVGHVRPASPYAYTLTGRLAGTHGHAERQELRRCSAEFERADRAS